MPGDVLLDCRQIDSAENSGQNLSLQVWQDLKSLFEANQSRPQNSEKQTTNELSFHPLPTGNSKEIEGPAQTEKKEADVEKHFDQHKALANADPETLKQKDRLLDDLRKVDDPAMQELKRLSEQNLMAFERRFPELEKLYEKQGMSPQAAAQKAHKEINDTLDNVCRLLEAGDNPNIPLTRSDRVKIAEQILAHAATPTSIDQGQHNTCNVTTVEVRTFMRNPAEAAALITAVAITGQYTAADGTRVALDKDSLTPHDEATPMLTYDGGRTLASQLFQVTAVNIALAKDNPDIQYVQKEPDQGAHPPDTGERMVDKSTGQEWKLSRWGEFKRDWLNGSDAVHRKPGLDDDQLVKIETAINGPEASRWFIEYGDSGTKLTDKFTSEAQLNNLLANAKKTGSLPLTILVHTGNEPFFTDSGAGAAGGSGGWHVVNITDYDPGPPAPKVQVDNQWGSSSDHFDGRAIAVHDLFLSTQDPTKEEGFGYRQQQVRGIYDQHKKNQLQDSDYSALLAEQIIGAGADYHKEGSKHSKACEQTKAMLEKMIGTMPPMQRIDYIEKAWHAGLIPVEECAEWLAQQQNKLIRGYTDGEDPEKLWDRIQKVKKQFPQDQQKRFDDRYDYFINDGFSTHSDHPFPG